MRDPYILGWAILLFSSIAWYAFLVFYIGVRAGKELIALIQHLTERQAEALRRARDSAPTP